MYLHIPNVQLAAGAVLPDSAAEASAESQTHSVMRRANEKAEASEGIATSAQLVDSGVTEAHSGVEIQEVHHAIPAWPSAPIGDIGTLNFVCCNDHNFHLRYTRFLQNSCRRT